MHETAGINHSSPWLCWPGGSAQDSIGKCSHTTCCNGRGFFVTNSPQLTAEILDLSPYHQVICLYKGKQFQKQTKLPLAFLSIFLFELMTWTKNIKYWDLPLLHTHTLHYWSLDWFTGIKTKPNLSWLKCWFKFKWFYAVIAETSTSSDVMSLMCMKPSSHMKKKILCCFYPILVAVRSSTAWIASGIVTIDHLPLFQF